jgi:hypothetical protein
MTFDIEKAIQKANADYVNPLLPECQICGHRRCICHTDVMPEERSPLTNHDLTEEQRLDDPRRS